MSTSLVVGNGESRYGLDISKFQQDYTVIGCNAIHRDCKVDHLVCCDRRMAEEAQESENTKNTLIYVRERWHKYYRKVCKDKRFRMVPDVPTEGIIKQDQPDHWGSGPYAVLLAANISDNIILVGFDLYPTNEKVNNIYKGTKNYAKRDAKPVDPNYWVHQIATVFREYSEKEFIIMNLKDWEMPREWKLPNVRFEQTMY
jgi:hypothetical protein